MIRLMQCSFPVSVLSGLEYDGFGALQCIELVATGATTTMSVDFADAAARNGNWGIIAVVINAAVGGTSVPPLFYPKKVFFDV